MDSFMSFAKQALESEVQKREGDSPSIAPPDTNPGVPIPDASRVAEHAKPYDDIEKSFLDRALTHLNHNKDKHAEEPDEDAIVKAHADAYSQKDAGPLPASSIGSAAALEAFKKFTSGSAPAERGGKQGDMVSKLLSLAMQEASKLFDRSGSTGGNKQDAINGAAMTMMKLVMKSKLTGAVGGGDSGGLGGLLGMASKFM